MIEVPVRFSLISWPFFGLIGRVQPLHGYSIRRPCFVGNGRRLVLPAFGTFAGGLNILEAAFEPLFGDDGLRVWMLGQEGLYPVAARLLRGD